MVDDVRVEEAKRISMLQVAADLGANDLRRNGHEFSGACPSCGSAGHNPKSGPVNRFNIHSTTNKFLCRRCGIKGGDQIGLVMAVKGVGFLDALTWLCGARRDDTRTEAEKQRERERLETEAEQQRAKDEEYRQRRIASARAIWSEGKPAARTAVADYLSARGMPAWLHDAPPHCLRFHPALRYTVPSASGQGYDVIHTGPAMLAAVQAPDRSLIGVHRTWIDPSRPKGKALIVGADGTPLQVKKILGSKKGGAIRLVGQGECDTLIMGEGIETTLSAYAAGSHVSSAAYWAGVDLGNMAGRRILRGEGMKYRGIPDLEDRDAFVAPPWLKRLVFIQDGDSEPRATRAKLMSGLRRAKHFNPALRIQIAHAGDGMDLNDVLMDRGENDGDA